MENSTKTREIVGQLRVACLEMARGFEQMELGAEITPDTWGEAVSALSESLAVARVAWAELVAERTECRPAEVYQCGECGNWWPQAQGSTCKVCRIPATLVANTFGLTVEGCQYSVQLLDATDQAMAGASFTVADNDAAEDEARALALMHDWCVRARLRNKRSRHEWTIEIRL